MNLEIFVDLKTRFYRTLQSCNIHTFVDNLHQIGLQGSLENNFLATPQVKKRPSSHRCPILPGGHLHFPVI